MNLNEFVFVLKIQLTDNWTGNYASNCFTSQSQHHASRFSAQMKDWRLVESLTIAKKHRRPSAIGCKRLSWFLTTCRNKIQSPYFFFLRKKISGIRLILRLILETNTTCTLLLRFSNIPHMSHPATLKQRSVWPII